MLNWAEPALRAKNLIVASAQAMEARKLDDAIELANRAAHEVGQFQRCLATEWQRQKASGMPKGGPE